MQKFERFIVYPLLIMALFYSLSGAQITTATENVIDKLIVRKISVVNDAGEEVINIKSIVSLLLAEADKFVRELDDYGGIYLYTGSEDTKNLYQHLGYQLIDQKENNHLVVYHMFKPV